MLFQFHAIDDDATVATANTSWTDDSNDDDVSSSFRQYVRAKELIEALAAIDARGRRFAKYVEADLCAYADNDFGEGRVNSTFARVREIYAGNDDIHHLMDQISLQQINDLSDEQKTNFCNALSPTPPMRPSGFFGGRFKTLRRRINFPPIGWGIRSSQAAARATGEVEPGTTSIDRHEATVHDSPRGIDNEHVTHSGDRSLRHEQDAPSGDRRPSSSDRSSVNN